MSEKNFLKIISKRILTWIKKNKKSAKQYNDTLERLIETQKACNNELQFLNECILKTNRCLEDISFAYEKYNRER
jgi:hypothetical protein